MTATRVFLVLFSLLSLVLNIAGQVCVPDTAGASAEYGNAGGVYTAAGSLGTVTGVHIERATTNQGKLWVVSTSTNQVFRYASAFSFSSTTAPELTFTSATGGTPILSGPTYMTTDSTGTCYLSDTGNHRVLIFGSCYTNTGSTGPTGVLGQTTLTSNTAGAASGGAPMLNPTGLGFDTSITGAPSATNPFFVSNRGLNEIIYYTAVTTTSTGATTTPIVGAGAHATAGSAVMNFPNGLAYGSTLDVLWVADTSNNRVAIITAGKTQATGTTPVSLGSGTAACSAAALNLPQGVGFDVSGTGTLYIADSSNFRVVYVTAGFSAAGATISGVIFPSGAAVTTCAAAAAVTQNSGSAPTDVEVVPIGTLSPSGAAGPTLVIADSANGRVLKICSGTATMSISLSNAGLSPSLSASLAVVAVSPSFSASVGSVGVSPSWSASFGSAAGTSASLSASGASVASSASNTITVSITATFSITVSLTTSITTSLTTSITTSVTNTNSFTTSNTNSVTNSYTSSVTNSYTRTVSNSNSYTQSISVSRSLRLCGNGKIDGKEKCDEGTTTNGTPHSCCRRNCRFKDGGHICRAPLGTQCYGKGRCDHAGKCRDLKIKTGKRCNVGGSSTGVKDGRCNISAVCVASA